MRQPSIDCLEWFFFILFYIWFLLLLTSLCLCGKEEMKNHPAFDKDKDCGKWWWWDLVAELWSISSQRMWWNGGKLEWKRMPKEKWFNQKLYFDSDSLQLGTHNWMGWRMGCRRKKFINIFFYMILQNIKFIPFVSINFH